MGRPLAEIEFFAYEREVWFRKEGKIERLTEKHTEIIEGMMEMISTYYPKAYAALCETYSGCALNKLYYRYRIVARFVKCNFAQHDNIADVGAGGEMVFEYVACPLRGECAHECVVCRPEFDHRLSSAEWPVMRLWYEGRSEQEIAERLCLSPHTVHNHIRHAYKRTGAHTRGEFTRYASKHELFK